MSEAVYIEKLNMLPEHMRAAMRNWIEYGVRPGNFLTAVLENNLMEAFGRADAINQYAIRDYVSFLYNFAPSECWGSREKVARWDGIVYAVYNKPYEEIDINEGSKE